MFRYLLLALATLNLSDGLGANGQAPSRAEPNPDQYSIVNLMRDAVRNEGIYRQSDQTTYNPVPETVKTCFKNGQQGECVKVHLCDSNDTIITNGLIKGKPVIEFRDLGECNNYLLTCCFLRKQEIPTPEIPKGCGWANPDGVGFKIKHSYDGETNFAEFPWTVALHKKSDFVLDIGQPLYTFLGGGSLIHRKVALTAAHSLVREPAENFMVRAGEWDINSKDEPYGYQDRAVREVVTHPNYAENGIYDVALLFLESAVELTPNVGVACLAPIGVRAAAGARCIATGWGKKRKENTQLADILKRVEVPVVSRAQCEAELRRSELGRHYVLDGSLLCAGGGGQDTCKGDGGAPLVCPSSLPNRYIQYGIVSWGIGCHMYPGVYADVGYLRGWIDDTVRSHGFDPSVYSIDTSEGRANMGSFYH